MQEQTRTPRLVPDVAALDLGSLPWQTSSYSSGHGGNCVEIAQVAGGGVVVRHSQRPDGPVVAFSTDEWYAFLDGADEFRFGW